MQTFIIKVNGDYYAGEHVLTQSTQRYSDGWYVNRGDSNAIHFKKNREEAQIIEGNINLNSHWQRIYNAMRFDGLEVNKIEIEAIA